MKTKYKIYILVLSINLLSALINLAIAVNKLSNERGHNLSFISISLLSFCFGLSILNEGLKEEKESKMISHCSGCKYFHGMDEIICAVHPSGKRNCTDYSQVLKITEIYLRSEMLHPDTKLYIYSCLERESEPNVGIVKDS
jgi:hypothetical protein